MRMRGACAGQPRVCPGSCNPRNRRRYGNEEKQQEHRAMNRVATYNSECSRLPRVQSGLLNSRPCSPGLSPEDREFVNDVAQRIRERRRTRDSQEVRRIKRLIAFVMFFMLHGLVAMWAKNYQQYQSFLATQFCGFITIMFWEDRTQR